MTDEFDAQPEMSSNDRLEIANRALGALSDTVEACARELAALAPTDPARSSLALQLSQLRAQHGRAWPRLLSTKGSLYELMRTHNIVSRPPPLHRQP